MIVSVGQANPLNFRGTWGSTHSYSPNDVVLFDSSSWICLEKVASDSAPPSNGAVWSTVGGAGGGGGPTGPTGVTGPTGATGPIGPSSTPAANLTLGPTTAGGPLTVPHGLSSVPLYVIFIPTSSGTFWFQSPTTWDDTNLFLVASDVDVKATALVFL